MTDLPDIAGANGVALPALGLGTYGMSPAQLQTMIPAALQAGLRHIDTAQVYRNEGAVGDLVVASGVPRQDLFLTTKIWVANYAPGAFEVSLEASLKRLRTDYVDLLLLHWPGSPVPLKDQVAGLESAVKAGMARRVGLSNFNGAMAAEAVRLSAVPLATNQIEIHPYLNQDLAIERTHRVGLSVTGYCAMAVGRVFAEPALQRIAMERGRSIAQVVLRWLFQQGIATLTRSTNPERIADNLRIFDFELSIDDMSQISALADPAGRIVDPAGLAPVWDPTPGRASAPRHPSR